jgi:hypothetical protein
MPGPLTAYPAGTHAARPAANSGAILYACSDHGVVYRAAGDPPAWTTWAVIGGPGAIELQFDGAGSAISTGVKMDFEIPFNCTLTGWTILGDQSGSIVIDIWKDSYANYPPVVGDSICGASKPTVSAAVKGQDLDIADWTGETLTQGDILRFNVDSVSGFTRVTLSLRYARA